MCGTAFKKNTEQKGSGKWIWLFAIAHLFCCGLPLLILSGVSIVTFFKSNAVIAVGLAALGVIGFMWYLKRGCATCPRNEGRSMGGNCKTPIGKRTTKIEQ